MRIDDEGRDRRQRFGDQELEIEIKASQNQDERMT